ncbi:MAG: hypothetical protein ACREFQ_20350 [Stellaceae bacterium]
MAIAEFFHIMAAIIWVGGMFFAYVMLRPAVGSLDPAVRLPLFRRVLANFFPWVWASIVVLLASAYGVMVPHLGRPAYVEVMEILGLIMMAAFLHLFFAPWKRFRRAVDAGNWQAAAPQLNQIRWIVLLNLVLGIVVASVGGTGRYWG